MHARSSATTWSSRLPAGATRPADPRPLARRPAASAASVGSDRSARSAAAVGYGNARSINARARPAVRARASPSRRLFRLVRRAGSGVAGEPAAFSEPSDPPPPLAIVRRRSAPTATSAYRHSSVACGATQSRSTS
eukprot:865926-Pyramimonas_sp.AAC.1